MPKYHRLSEAQLNNLNFEFAQFLAALGIDKREWTALKDKEDSKIELLLDKFSDVVWEKLFDEASYLEFISSDKAFLLHAKEKTIKLIVVECNSSLIDMRNKADWEWIFRNLKHPDLNFYTSEKKYDEERNLVLYDHFKKGAEITKGKLFCLWEPILKDSIK